MIEGFWVYIQSSKCTQLIILYLSIAVTGHSTVVISQLNHRCVYSYSIHSLHNEWYLWGWNRFFCWRIGTTSRRGIVYNGIVKMWTNYVRLPAGSSMSVLVPVLQACYNTIPESQWYSSSSLPICVMVMSYDLVAVLFNACNNPCNITTKNYTSRVLHLSRRPLILDACSHIVNSNFQFAPCINLFVYPCNKKGLHLGHANFMEIYYITV